jgi:hypothetical protein
MIAIMGMLERALDRFQLLINLAGFTVALSLNDL